MLPRHFFARAHESCEFEGKYAPLATRIVLDSSAKLLCARSNDAIHTILSLAHSIVTDDLNLAPKVTQERGEKI